MVLDELGRGTATLDGAAVAGAVLAHLAGAVGCRGLFATHYHHLSDEHVGDSRVSWVCRGVTGGFAMAEKKAGGLWRELVALEGLQRSSAW